MQREGDTTERQTGERWWLRPSPCLGLAISLGAALLLYWIDWATGRLSWGLSDYPLLRRVVTYLQRGLFPLLCGLMIGYWSGRGGWVLGTMPPAWKQLWILRRLVWIYHQPDLINQQLLRPVVFVQLLAGALGGYLGQRLRQMVVALEEEGEGEE